MYVGVPLTPLPLVLFLRRSRLLQVVAVASLRQCLSSTSENEFRNYFIFFLNLLEASWVFSHVVVFFYVSCSWVLEFTNALWQVCPVLLSQNHELPNCSQNVWQMFIFSILVILKIVHAVLFFPTLVKALALCGRNLEPGVRAHEWSAVRLNGCAVVSGPFSRGVAQLWALVCDQWTDCTRCNGFHCFVHSAVLLSMASSNV